MNLRMLFALAAALALGGAANGEFVGVHIDVLDRDYFANYTGDPGIDAEVVHFYDAGFRVYRIYLEFDNLEEDAGDRLLWWGGTDGSGELGPLQISGSALYNAEWADPFFAPPFNEVFIPGQRDQPYDSWISFGSTDEGDPADGVLLGEFADGTIPMWDSPLYSEDAGITADPALNQGDAWAQATPGLVPIFQLGMPFDAFYSLLPISFAFTWDVEGIGIPNNEFIVLDVPAPGAIALFALAGLAGPRRRRA
jgi:hypothetical protein